MGQRKLTTLSDTRRSRRVPQYWLAIGSSATHSRCDGSYQNVMRGDALTSIEVINNDAESARAASSRNKHTDLRGR